MAKLALVGVDGTKALPRVAPRITRAAVENFMVDFKDFEERKSEK